MEEGTGLAVAFGRAARAAGLDASVASVIAYGEALQLVGLDRPDDLYWAGHAIFVGGPEDVPTYQRTFAAFFSGLVPAALAVPPEIEVALGLDGGEAETSDTDEEAARDSLELRYSATELLSDKDFAKCSPQELAELYQMMDALGSRPPMRRSRRRRPASRNQGELDLRRSVRRALRSLGEPVHLARTEPSERTRRVVVLVDVSGSMEPYARAFLHFAHVVVAVGGRGEAFTLGTRLTRITRELASRDPDAALRRAADAVSDLAGGTRLGAGLREFNDRYGVSGTARGAVVVILSDGWDRGDPGEVAIEMARLARVAYRIIWVNPLKAGPGYEPLAGGMAAALPFVDRFVEGHSLAALRRVAVEMAR